MKREEIQQLIEVATGAKPFYVMDMVSPGTILDLCRLAIDGLEMRPCVQYFVDRCENKHPDGYIRSQRTYEMFKQALEDTCASSEKPSAP